MDIIFSEECLNFKDEIIPESPERVSKAREYLDNRGYNFTPPQLCSEEDLFRVHERGFVRNVKENNYYDRECPHYEGIFKYARLAAGGAIKAAKTNGFSLMRPPGHHAGRDFLGGFCYFNNLAVAVRKINMKTLIIDIDAHHGNGTEDIFRDDSSIFYLSLHKNTYPGTGHESGNNVFNHVFFGEPGDDEYIKVLEDGLKIDREFEIVAVSAGFDGYKGDPLAPLGLTCEGYYRIGKVIASLDLPVFCVLEGGYNSGMLGENIHNFIQGLQDSR